MTHRVQTCSGIGYLFANLCSPRLRKTDNPFIPFIPEARLFRLWGKGGVYGINENKRIRLFAVNGVYRGGKGRLSRLWCGRRRRGHDLRYFPHDVVAETDFWRNFLEIVAKWTNSHGAWLDHDKWGWGRGSEHKFANKYPFPLQVWTR